MNNSNEHVTFTSHGKVYGSNPAATPSKLAEVYIPKAEQQKMRVNVETTSRMGTGDKAIRSVGLAGFEPRVVFESNYFRAIGSAVPSARPKNGP